MAEHNDTGRWGEQKAAEYLERKGYRILWRDWRKTRRNADYMPPELAVDARKMRSLAVAAAKLVGTYGIEFPLRFDIVAVTGTPGGDCDIRHIEDAFTPMQY